MALTNTEEVAEKSLYLAIEKILVKEGYTPDPDDFDFDQVDKTSLESSWRTAMSNIASNKGFAIELFNFDNAQEKGIKKVPRIVIDTMGFFPGNIGKDSTLQYELQQDDTFNGISDGEKTSDIYININLVAKNVEQIRILHAVISKAIPRRGYIPRFIDNDTDIELLNKGNIFIEYIDYNDSSDPSQGIIEKVYRYMIPDLSENLPEIRDTGVSKIIEIEDNIKTD